MKNLFKNLMLVAVAAMGFTACEQVGVESVTPVLPEVKMTVIAGMDDTRTYIDEANGMVQWSEDDQLMIIENSATYRITSTDDTTIDADGKAKFAVSFPANTTDAEFTYNAVFPASAIEGDDAEKVNSEKLKVSIKNQQKATATSFDPQADVLVSKQLVFNNQPTELKMQFKRLVALGKMTLKNLPVDAKIKSVVFTAGAEDVLAGRNYVNATTGNVSEYGYYNKTNTITINYDEAIATRDIYFTCNPFEMEAGETFKVKAVCGNKSYTREVTIPADRSLTFTEGNLGTFSVDMASATVESISAFAEGDYVVLAYSGSGDKYYAMNNATGNVRGYSEVTYDGEAALFATTDETLKWTIEAVNGGYAMKDVNGKYISWSDGNKAPLSDTAMTLNITLAENKICYNINIVETPERYLQYNSGSPRFAFYTTNQVRDLYLVPIGEDTTPRFTVNPKECAFTIEGGTATFTATPNAYLTTTISATENADWLTVTPNGNTFTVDADENDDVARVATITFSAEGAENVVVTVSQAGVTASITVAEFIKRADENTEYILTGKISNVTNTTYGNFDLTDETGTIYVYGIYDNGSMAWTAKGLKEGDTITLKGKYLYYNSTKHEVVDAQYISHVSAPFITVNPVSVAANATTATINVKSNVAWSVSCSEDWVKSYTESGENDGAINVEMSANNTTNGRVATFTLSAEDVSPVEVKLTQAGISTGEEQPKTYTLQFGSNYNSKGQSSYSNSWYVTCDGFIWDIVNANNNNNGWNYIKIGSKNAAYIGEITTRNAMPESIKTVKMNVSAVTASKINSIKLYVATDSAFSQNVQTVPVTPTTGDLTFTIPTPTANCYYKIEVDCQKASSNGPITITKVVYTNN